MVRPSHTLVELISRCRCGVQQPHTLTKLGLTMPTLLLSLTTGAIWDRGTARAADQLGSDTTIGPLSDTLLNAITLYPSDDVAAAVSRQPKGTEFVLSPGLYAHFSVIPKEGDSFTGLPGAILSGAQRITEFGREGSLHVAHLPRSPGQVHGACQSGHRCDRPEDLFIDNVLQQHVTRTAVTVGTYFIDYETGTIIFGTDPTRHRVEISSTRHAFAGTADHVHLRGFVIEKYAIPAQMGAVGDSIRPRYWLIENCEIRFNHGAGISVGDSSRILRNFIHYNFQIGISGGGNNIEIEKNEIPENNTAGFLTIGKPADLS